MTTATQSPSRPTGEPWDILAAAKHLHVSDRHLRRLIDEGKIMAIRLGRRVLIADAEMQRVANSGTGE